MKTPTKAELWETIHALQAENEKQREAMMKKEREAWERRIPRAKEVLHMELKSAFGALYCNVQFEHVDASGYWFTFELENENRRQTLAIRHNQL